jgi:hypothetical protein
VWISAEELQVTRLVVINSLYSDSARLDRSLESLRGVY